MFKSIITNEELNTLPPLDFTGNIHLISNDNQVESAINILKDHKILGFDTESKPNFVKGKKNSISIIQLASLNDAFIFQIRYLKNIDPIFSILSNPDILKVGLAINNDFNEIRRFHNFEEQNFIDLQKYVKKFNIDELSLKKIAAIVLGHRISKSQQRSNWGAEVLSPAQIKYAAIDAWACLLIYNKLNEHNKK